MSTIGVFFGSRSPEHDVSIITAQLIMSELKQMKRPFVPVYLDKQGRWHLDEQLGSLAFFKGDDAGLEKLTPWMLDLEQSQKKMVFKQNSWRGKEITIDIAFPAFHGQNGEDGTMQGVFELCNVPYVGCDVTSSAIAMDKALTKDFYRAHSVPTTAYTYFTDHEYDVDREAVMRRIGELRYPLFVKPTRLGSSIGIAKVKTAAELEDAIAVALHYDSKIIVEEGVENLADLTCAVKGYDVIEASLVQETLFSQDLYSYEDKYLENGGAHTGNAADKVIIPARIPAEITDQVQTLAKSIYRQLGCAGIARVDFLYDAKAKALYANEINTLPGTLYHHLWKKSGTDFATLLDELITYAHQAHSRKNKRISHFQSAILQQANSQKLQAKLHDPSA